MTNPRERLLRCATNPPVRGVVTESVAPNIYDEVKGMQEISTHNSCVYVSHYEVPHETTM